MRTQHWAEYPYYGFHFTFAHSTESNVNKHKRAINIIERLTELQCARLIVNYIKKNTSIKIKYKYETHVYDKNSIFYIENSVNTYLDIYIITETTYGSVDSYYVRKNLLLGLLLQVINHKGFYKKEIPFSLLKTHKLKILKNENDLTDIF